MTDVAKEAKKAPKKVRITIHSEGEGGDKGDVILVHNYRQIQIKRDIPVEVDECYLDVLKASVIDTVVKGEDEKMRPVKIPRYSYSVEAV